MRITLIHQTITPIKIKRIITHFIINSNIALFAVKNINRLPVTIAFTNVSSRDFWYPLAEAQMSNKQTNVRNHITD